MALNFPSSPTENQEYTSGGVTFVYTNGKWIAKVTGLVPVVILVV